MTEFNKKSFSVFMKNRGHVEVDEKTHQDNWERTFGPKKCMCEGDRPGVVHRTDGPCYVDEVPVYYPCKNDSCEYMTETPELACVTCLIHGKPGGMYR